MKNCKNCRSKNFNNAKFCANCGYEFKSFPLKGLIALLLFCSVFGYIGIWFYIQTPDKKVLPAAILPNETLQITEIINIEKRLDDFRASQLGQTIAQIDWKAVMRKLGLHQKIIVQYDKLEELLASTIDNLVFNELFGKEVTIAVLPVTIDKLEIKSIKKLLSSIVIISRPKRSTEFVKLASQLVSGIYNYQTEIYEDCEIKSFTTELEVTVYYTVVGGLFVATLNRQTLLSCLDLRKNQRPDLTQNTYFQDLNKKLRNSNSVGFTYTNLTKLYETIFNLIKASIDAEKRDDFFDQARQYAQPFKAGGHSVYEKGDLIHSRSLVLIENSTDPNASPLMAQFKAGANKTLDMIPAESLIYYWANNLDIFLNEESQFFNKDVRKALKVWLQEAGVSLNQFFHAFGKQYGLALADFDTRKIIPIPKLALFAEVKSYDVVTNILETSAKKLGMNTEIEEFEGIEINYFTLPLGLSTMLPLLEDITPSYCFIKNFCLVTSNRQLMMDMIDIYYYGGGIQADSGFRAVDKGLTGPNNNIMFIRNAAFIEKFKDVIAWCNSIVAFQNIEIAKKLNIVREEVLVPILDGLQMYEAFGSRTTISDEQIETYTCLKIN